MLTLTLKNVPEELHALLKKSAAKNRRSLNSEILARLEREVSVRGCWFWITGSATVTSARG